MQHKRLQGLLVLIPSRNRSMGNFVSSPSEVSGRTATENEFGYSTAVSIILVTIMLMILRCMFYTRKLNNTFNYRKQIAPSSWLHAAVIPKKKEKKNRILFTTTELTNKTEIDTLADILMDGCRKARAIGAGRP